MQIKLANPKTIELATKILQDGGVVAYPSETCYGLLANFHNKDAIAKIFQIKQRPLEKKLLLLVRDIAQAQELVTPTPLGMQLMQEYWPGALTIIQPILAGDTLALRSPDHEFSQKLLAQCGFPLVSTSANLSGEDNPYTFDDIKNLKADLLIDGGDLPSTPPSTLVDATGNEAKILRQGEIKI